MIKVRDKLIFILIILWIDPISTRFIFINRHPQSLAPPQRKQTATPQSSPNPERSFILHAFYIRLPRPRPQQPQNVQENVQIQPQRRPLIWFASHVVNINRRPTPQYSRHQEEVAGSYHRNPAPVPQDHQNGRIIMRQRRSSKRKHHKHREEKEDSEHNVDKVDAHVETHVESEETRVEKGEIHVETHTKRQEHAIEQQQMPQMPQHHQIDPCPVLQILCFENPDDYCSPYEYYCGMDGAASQSATIIEKSVQCVLNVISGRVNSPLHQKLNCPFTSNPLIKL